MGTSRTPGHAAAERPEGLGVMKRLLLGRPRETGEMDETLLSKTLALPIFSADPLSSVAYATEAAMVVLVGVSVAALNLVLPISIAIAAVLAIVVVSYTQTVRAYETSGGAYVVAKDNLGTLPSLVAAAALLVDYVLTVAVSVTAGVLAVTSAAPSLASHKVGLSLFFVLLLTVVNLRGVRESGMLFAVPTYGFVAVMFVLIGTGVGRCLDGTCPQASVPDPLATGAGAVSVLIVLRAFASGASALTGVESISNGVNAFRLPHGRNAALTLVAMGAFAISLFLGVSYLAVSMNAAPSGSVSVLSEIARAAFPGSSSTSFLYYAVQGLTFAVLVLAANTSYQGFPRLAAVLARDRFFPRQFVNLGDRLVYSNGIIVLAAVSSLLIWAFDADVIALIHLYVIGVFTAFTLSQAGMVRYWLRREKPAWRRSALINGAGAVATGVVALLVIESKFTQGAWAVIVAIPVLIGGFYGIHRHYRKVSRRLRAGIAAVAAAPRATNEVVLYVESADAALQEALWYARQISGDDFHAIHVPGRGTDPGIRPRFRQLTEMRPDLEIVRPADGRLDAVIEYLWGLPRGESTFVTIVVPELFHSRSLVSAVTRGPEFRLKLRLLTEPGVVITDVPVLAKNGGRSGQRRAAARILVSGAHAATMRAVNYAGTLGFADTKAVFFAFDDEEAERMKREWEELEMAVPLVIEEAPFRDVGDPLLAHLRRITEDPNAVAVAIMPELIFSGAARLLHNQRALYIKRLLLFEPRVILTSVPYRLN
ncbi:MAG: APC family permease [Actinobacteria bacterium]|nr:MAG: APC family permease [Actinomycetota bacterium]